MPLWSVIPFVLMLVAIAVLPLVREHWWEKNANKLLVSAILGAPIGAWILYVSPGELANVCLEYLSFMCLLGSLYIISGGIVLRGDLRATPAVNTAFLAVGAVLASFMGTTGAAMLLIRPLLKTNSERAHKVHTVVFFIFLVANIGGCLTPLGDPPLFMGYLRGVPFAWTLRLWPEWLFAVATLLGVYYLWDARRWAQESDAAKRLDATMIEPLRLSGGVNIPLLLGVVAAVAFGASAPHGVREVVMLALAGASLRLTPRARRVENGFTFGPIVEVAALFAGIFLTMIPALLILEHHGAELGVTHPSEYFWASGMLSSFLDNTPTYVVFYELAHTSFPGGVPDDILAGLSLGAVFMGANTYIGNGPNFMVKAIAEGAGVKMPTFGGYMLYAVSVLIPVFVALTLIFF